MTGSLQEKSGKYYVVLSFKDDSGKWKRKWISTGLDIKNNKKKAEAFMQKTIYEYGKASDVELARINPSDAFDRSSAFSDYILRWLDSTKNNLHLQRTTIEFYESLCKNHIYPYFVQRDYSLYEITTETLQEFIDYEIKNGNSHKKEVG